jgi:hypothetical protein
LLVAFLRFRGAHAGAIVVVVNVNESRSKRVMKKWGGGIKYFYFSMKRVKEDSLGNGDLRVRNFQ